MKISACITFSLVLIFLIASPVYAADTPLPDGTPTIDETHINRYMLEEDDFVLYFIVNIPYDTTPDLPVDRTFFISLIATDNTTVLGSREIYDFTNDGYGENPVSFYFDPDDAPTWGEEYTVRISGKPSAFADPPVYNIPLSASDYTDETGHTENQNEMRQYIIDIAQTLSVSMSIDLLEESDITTVFSSYGQELFRNAIPGIQNMLPSLFPIVIYQPDYSEREWTEAQSANYSGRYTDTPEGTAINDFWSSMIHVNFSLAASIPIIVACVAFMIMSAKQTEQIYSGLLNCSAAVIISGPAGWIPMAIISIIMLFLTFYSSTRIFLKS